MTAIHASGPARPDQRPRSADPAESPEPLSPRAKALAPYLRERSAEIERQRRLPSDVVEALRDIGVFRMGLPRRWGGLELSSMAQTEVIEALSYGDASAGWCAMIGS